jgi:beta-lactamase superfamily II metal-dependent hydrolase
MKRPWSILTFVAACSVALAAQTKPTKPLEIYVVDPEGGKEALWVTPAGQAILIDTGSPGGRDTDRIMEAINAAGVKKIDIMLSTHYHVDHVGGLQELVKRIPIDHFYDHGETIETGVDGRQKEQVPGFWAWYVPYVSKVPRTVLKPGDRIPVTGLDWRIVTSAGQVLKTPLPGAGKPNPLCAGTERRTVTLDPEDGQSVGSVITYGKWRALDFGDMTWDIEHDLMCPNNPLGTVDVYFVSDHGINDNSTPEFVHAIKPRVAIMQNSARKGNAVDVLKVIRSSPGLEDIWQLHWGNAAGAEWNSAGVYIANGTDPAEVAAALTAPPPAPRGGGAGRAAGPAPGAPADPAAGAPPAAAPPAAAPPAAQPPATAQAPAPGAPPAAGAPPAQAAPGAARGGRAGTPPHSPAYWIKISVQPDGTFTVLNSRNNFSKTYVPR